MKEMKENELMHDCNLDYLKKKITLRVSELNIKVKFKIKFGNL